MQTRGDPLKKISAECDTRNTRLVGHHDLDGSGDGMQIIKYGQFAYVAHVGKSKMALSILDVSDPSSATGPKSSIPDIAASRIRRTASEIKSRA
jgi:hypothetical protein